MKFRLSCICFLLLWSGFAQASYVNACLFDAVVLESTSTRIEYRDDGEGENSSGRQTYSLLLDENNK